MVEVKNGTQATSESLTINLFGPGMTAFHKVGLAGLWMTLEAIESENGSRAAFPNGTGSWERRHNSVTLRWNGKAEPFFKTLLERSFKIDNKGLLWFPALGQPMDHPSHSTILNEAILSVHFQIPRTRGAKKQRQEISVQVDDATEVLHFLPFEWISHQKAFKNFGGRNSIPIVSWLLPGATLRHETHKNTALEEDWKGFLSLLYLPVGAVYFRVNQKVTRPKDRRKQASGVPKFAMILPEISNFESYSVLRKSFLPYGTGELSVSGTAEAGWRLLAIAYAKNLLTDLRASSCTVVSFGASPGTRQNTRIALAVVRPGSESALRMFALCRNFLAPELVRQEEGDTFWYIPQVPGLVANNLCVGRNWWEDFADFISDKVRQKNVFSNEKGGLAKMVENTEAFPDGPERTFVLACHEAWRRRMGQISEKAKREHSSFPDQVNREFERIRVSFSRCKNAASLREAVTDFWSRSGGPVEPLQDGWRDVLTLMDEINWRKGRDLALLALASYKPATKEEAKALETPTTKP